MPKHRGRIGDALITSVQNHAAFLEPAKLHFSDEFQIKYMANTPSGCLMSTWDPVLGEQVYEIKVVARKNLRNSR